MTETLNSFIPQKQWVVGTSGLVGTLNPFDRTEVSVMAIHVFVRCFPF